MLASIAIYIQSGCILLMRLNEYIYFLGLQKLNTFSQKRTEEVNWNIFKTSHC